MVLGKTLELSPDPHVNMDVLHRPPPPGPAAATRESEGYSTVYEIQLFEFSTLFQLIIFKVLSAILC
jgi:hypothetical protein